MILAGFGRHFESQNGAKMDSKIDQQFDGFLDRSWKGSERQQGRTEPLNPPVQGPRGRVGKG